jgi:4-hydroxybenzoate polyprenyltransferase
LVDQEVDEKSKKFLSDAVKSLGPMTLKKIITGELVAAGFIIVILCVLKRDIIYSLAFLAVIPGYVYSVPPLRLKKRGILSPLPVMFGLYFLPVVAGYFIVRNQVSVFILLFGTGYALIMEGITFINTCEDFEEDKISGIRTIAHVLGIRKTLFLGSIFVSVGGCIALGLISYRLKPESIQIIPCAVVFALGIVFVGSIIYISRKLFIISKSNRPLVLCKKYAVKMPIWFLVTRYPLFFLALLPTIYP